MSQTEVQLIKDAVIVNADISNSAAIDVSKISGAMPLAGGIFTGVTEFTANAKFDGATAGRDITFLRSTNTLRFQDNTILGLGDGDDFKMFHNGTITRFVHDLADANLEFQSDNFLFKDKDNGDVMAKMLHDGAVELYHDNSKKLETVTAGISVNGQVSADNLHIGDGSTGIKVGDSDDLLIYHDGTESYIDSNTGTLKIISDGGGLKLLSESNIILRDNDDTTNLIRCINGGQIELYHNGSKKLETTSDGGKITGELDVHKSGTGDIFHVQGNGTGAVVAKVENAYNSDNDRFAILELKSGKGSIRFNSNSDSNEGAITYEMATNAMIFGVNNATERMRLTSSGDVGIGTSSPSRKLEITDATFPALRIKNSSTSIANGTNIAGLEFEHADSSAAGVCAGINALMADTSTGALHMTFSTGTNVNLYRENMRLDSSGQLLIGLTSSGGDVQYLETNQPQASDHACAMFQSSTSSSLSQTHALRIQGHGFNSAFQGAHGIRFVNADDQDRGYQAILFRKADGSTNVGSISYNQNSTSYNTSSDYRLKENAVAISDGITRLKTLKPYRFNFKDNPSKTVDGFFAHECTAVPEAITGEKDAMKAETWYQEGDTIPSDKTVGMPKTYSSTEMEIQSLDQSKLVPLLVAAVKELITKVEALEAA